MYIFVNKYTSLLLLLSIPIISSKHFFPVSSVCQQETIWKLENELRLINDKRAI